MTTPTLFETSATVLIRHVITLSLSHPGDSIKWIVITVRLVVVAVTALKVTRPHSETYNWY